MAVEASLAATSEDAGLSVVNLRDEAAVLPQPLVPALGRMWRTVVRTRTSLVTLGARPGPCRLDIPRPRHTTRFGS